MRTLREQAQAVRSRQADPVDLVRAALERTEEVEHAANAFTTVLPDEAMDHAKRLRDLEPLGPLHGVPVAVKDLYDVAGSRTTGCCAAIDRRADADSAVVERLKRAGAVVMAKTNQHELALGTDNQTSTHGPARNPWDTARSPGGSSGGSGIAVAAGVVAMAMGSDTGGSIRIPASFCGVSGLKPTHGAVSSRGGMALAPSLDTFGPLAVSADDCWTVHQVVAAYDPEDPWSRRAPGQRSDASIAGARVAVLSSWLSLAVPEVAAAVRGAAELLAELGAVVTEVEGPDITNARVQIGPLLIAEASRTFEDILDDSRVSLGSRNLLSAGQTLSAGDYIASREACARTRRAFDALLDGADALLAPATPYSAPHTDETAISTPAGELPTDATGTTLFTIPVNAARLPALSFPVGICSEALPLGAQLIGPAWSEGLLCAIGSAYQAATSWHLRQADPKGS